MKIINRKKWLSKHNMPPSKLLKEYILLLKSLVFYFLAKLNF